VPQFNIHQAKAHLSELIKQAALGEDIVIARGGHPVARLTAYRAASGERRPGSARGSVRMADDFDAPLADFEEYQP